MKTLILCLLTLTCLQYAAQADDSLYQGKCIVYAQQNASAWTKVAEQSIDVPYTTNGGLMKQSHMIIPLTSGTQSFSIIGSFVSSSALLATTIVIDLPSVRIFNSDEHFTSATTNLIIESSYDIPGSIERASQLFTLKDSKTGFAATCGILKKK